MATIRWVAATLFVLFTLIPGLASADDTVDTPNYSVGQVLPDGRTVLYAWKSDTYVLGDIHRQMGGGSMTYDLGNVCEVVRSCANVPGGCDYVAWGSSDINHYDQVGLDHGLEGGLAAGRAGRASMAAIRACAGTTWDVNLYPHTSDDDRHSGIAIIARVPPKPKAQCADGIDNDGDGLVDFTPPSGKTKDDGCTSVDDDDEMSDEQRWAYLIPVARSQAGNPCSAVITGWYEEREPKYSVDFTVCACSTPDVSADEGFQMFSPEAAMSIAMSDMRTTAEKADKGITWTQLRVWLEAPMRAPAVQYVDASGHESKTPIGRGATVKDGGSIMTITLPNACTDAQAAEKSKASKAHEAAYTGANLRVGVDGQVGVTIPGPNNVYDLRSQPFGDAALELGVEFGKPKAAGFAQVRLGGGGDTNCFAPGHGLVGVEAGFIHNRSGYVGFEGSFKSDFGLAPWTKANDDGTSSTVLGMAYTSFDVSTQLRVAFGRGDHNGFLTAGPMGGIRIASVDPKGGSVSAIPTLIPNVGIRVGLGFTLGKAHKANPEEKSDEVPAS